MGLHGFARQIPPAIDPLDTGPFAIPAIVIQLMYASPDDATLNDKKRIARLDAFLDDATQASDDVSRYARQLMANCYLSIDAQRAFNLFDALLKAQRQISYATGRLKASRALAEKEGASKVGSESWQRYVQWREVYRAVESQDAGALDFEEALELLLECKQRQEFDYVWRDVPERFLLSCELVHVRCVYLQEQGQVDEALAHLHEVEKLHVELLPGRSRHSKRWKGISGRTTPCA
ncbi:hypothetical protein J3P91_15025 [Pseudomonas sp. Z4-7]|uniref:hypothetical protein n=1 Tax=Pseudomonas sp. Z4-7 TaxID=2817413 RepID=UPI003DA903FD